MTQGACLCGTVRFEVQPPYLWTAHCHCSMCRKQHGTLHGTVAAVAPGKFHWLQGEESVVHFRSSQKFERPFCKHCGSAVPDTSGEHVIIPVGLLEDDAGVVPQAHIFVASKSPMYEFIDSVQQFEEYPAGFGSAVAAPTFEASDNSVMHGSCLCGEVAFEIDATPRRLVNCHCSRCRRSRGTAHATNVFVQKDKLRWMRGAEQVQTYKVPDAAIFSTSFCRHCGSLLPSLFAAVNTYLVPVGSLNTEFPVQSRAHIYTDSKSKWFNIPDDALKFSTMPPREKFGEVLF